MNRPIHRRPTHIRAWRQHRGLSLRELADRVNGDLEEPLISHVSLGRIERGVQPYSQDMLEAVADALDVDPPTLLAHRPDETEPITSLWGRLNGRQRKVAMAIIQAVASII